MESRTGKLAQRNDAKTAVRYAVAVAALFAVLVVAQAAKRTLQLGRMRVSGVDPVEYYVFLPSLFFDGDLNFENEYAHFSPEFLRSGQWPKTATGHRAEPHGVGMAVALAPFYTAAYLVVSLEKDCFPVRPEFKYVPLFEQAWYVGNVLWSALAIFLLAWWLRRDVGAKRPLLIALVFFLSTPLLYYAFPLLPMSHSVSLAAILLMLLCLGNVSRTGKSRWWLLAGCWLGFAASVHILNAIYAFTILAYLLLDFAAKRRSPSAQILDVWKDILKPPTLIFVGAFCTSMPQFIAQRIIFGSSLINPYSPEAPAAQFSLSLSSLQAAWRVAFSLKHGFITWHPILGLGLVGLILITIQRKKHLALAAPGLIAVLGIWLLLSCFTNWWAGWSFGHRQFIAAYPFFALGLATLVDRFLERRRLWKAPVVWCLAGLFVLWNVLFLIQYKLGIIPRGEAITLHEYFRQKILLLSELLTGGIKLPL